MSRLYLYELGQPARLALAARVGSRFAPACPFCGGATARMTKHELAVAGLSGAVRWCVACRALSRVQVIGADGDNAGSWCVEPLP